MTQDFDTSADVEIQTTPKPFVFVLMPFEHKFDDVYKFGIKGAAEDAGAYAERVDEQYYDEGILGRIYNQINKADVIVADMTEHNSNVFYEVGYAHALGKLVLLLTQDSGDIPFDLKHHPHTVYDSIDVLRKALTQRLKWAIAESQRRRSTASADIFTVTISGVEIPELYQADKPPVVTLLTAGYFGNVAVTVDIRNGTPGTVLNFSHAYLFSSSDAKMLVNFSSPENSEAIQYAHSFKAHPQDVPDDLSWQYALPPPPPAIPFAAVESFTFYIELRGASLHSQAFRLRLLRDGLIHDFPFVAEGRLG